jgi:putative ABC transport system permease protein
MRGLVRVRGAGRPQRLAASLGVAVQLVRAGATAAPQRTAAAVAGHAAALTLVASGPAAGALGAGFTEAGILLVATVAVGVAAAVDRRELRAMAAVDLCGASGVQRRLVVLVEGVLLGLAALPFGAVAGAVVCALADEGGPRVLHAVAVAAVVPGLVALFAGRIRTRVTVVDASPDLPHAHASRHGLDLLRCLIGVSLVVIAALVGRRLQAFWELDLTLGPLIGIAAVGLLLALPPVIGWIGGGMARARAMPVALAGSALRERRRLLAPAAALGAVAAMVVAVQAVVGLGLAEREQLRRERLGDADRFTAGLSNRDVFVSRDSPPLLFAGLAFSPGGVDNPAMALPSDLADAVRRAVPGARVAGVEVLPVSIVGDPLEPRTYPFAVAVGTPELLDALGLERFAGDLAAGRAVVLAPGGAIDGQVTLRGLPYAAPGWSGSLPARLVQRRVVPQHEPSVLVPPSIGESVRRRAGNPDGWPNVNPAALVVGSDRPFSDDEVRAIAGAARPLDVVRGDSRVPGVLDRNRLDDSYAIVVESAADVRLAMAVAMIVSLVALAVALRLAALTGRPDDELLDVLGARPATLRRAAVGQALVVGLLAVPLGTAVGVLAATAGLDAYNGRGRFVDGVELPPIPVGVPTALVVGAALVPLAAALLAGLLAHRRRPIDPPSLADRLAW